MTTFMISSCSKVAGGWVPAVTIRTRHLGYGVGWKLEMGNGGDFLEGMCYVATPAVVQGPQTGQISRKRLGVGKM